MCVCVRVGDELRLEGTEITRWIFEFSRVDESDPLVDRRERPVALEKVNKMLLRRKRDFEFRPSSPCCYLCLRRLWNDSCTIASEGESHGYLDATPHSLIVMSVTRFEATTEGIIRWCCSTGVGHILYYSEYTELFVELSITSVSLVPRTRKK